MGLKEAILGAKTKLRRVETPTLDCECVWVRTLTAAEVMMMRDSDEGDEQWAWRLCVMAICDENGGRVFEDDDAEQVAALPYQAVAPIATAVMEHNGLTQGAAEETAKN